MALEEKEHKYVPVDVHEIKKVSNLDSDISRDRIVETIIKALSEKRDAYHGIISSIIHISDSGDRKLIQKLHNELIESITSNPMRYSGKIFTTKAIDCLSRECPDFLIDLFEQVIDDNIDWSKNFNSQREIRRIQIISIKAIRQAEQTQGARQTTLSRPQIDEICFDAVHICDDTTKVDTLALILACRKTTQPVTKREFDLFTILFKDALSFQEPSLRQIFLSQTGKFLIRIRESLRVLLRDCKNEIERERFSQDYNQFILWLVDYCFNSMYCNAYFGSFVLTISTLKLIIENITFANPVLKIKSHFERKQSYDALLSCLNDSFENNKAMALELLLSLSKNEIFLNETNVIRLEAIAQRLIFSVNPAHSLTCQYMYRLVIGLRLQLKTDQTTRNQLIRHYLDSLVTIVQDDLAKTKENFIYALNENPIHPKLTCIRALINDVQIENFELDRERWINLAKRIIDLSIEACSSVSQVVCNLNPETIGHLPMDLKPLSVDSLAETLNMKVNISHKDAATISSQMLLISGWKTIKECSLLLGSICDKFWWPKNRSKIKKEKCPGLDTKPILDSSDIEKTIAFFDHYLRNLRHRGAFEQAYNGFIMITRRIWHDEEYKVLLINILEQIMNDFRNDALDEKKANCLKAYVTRRSAGLPFIIQAILNSEHQHDSQTLRKILDCLFVVLKSPNTAEYQRIHCLNILKALTKEHFLAEKMVTFVAPIFEVALDSFKSDSFPIKNCASMLLKAVVDRTFGINRLRNDIHRRNQLSFERFFISCPKLHAKMLAHLRDGFSDRKYLASVHAIFIILSHLTSSSHTSNEYNYENIIDPFVDLLRAIALSCQDFKIRELAAKLSVRLCSFRETDNISQDSEYILNNISLESQSSKSSANQIHGALVMLKSWLECSSIPESGRDKFVELANRLVCRLLHSESNSLKLTALDLAESLLVKRSQNPECLDMLRHNLSACFQPVEIVECIAHAQEPHYEALLFKVISLILLVSVPELEGPAESFQYHDRHRTSHSQPRCEMLDGLLDALPTLIVPRPPRKCFSLSLQASLIRFVRQLLRESPEYVDSLDMLLDKLDIDPTACHSTPFDKLRLMGEIDSNRAEWVRYCDRPKLRACIRSDLMLEKLFNFREYQEFVPINGDFEKPKFSPKSSNTPRAIELLTFAYQIWDSMELSRRGIWCSADESMSSKLNYLTAFANSLGNCDVKCLAILCAGKLATDETRSIFLLSDEEYGGTTERERNLEAFSCLLDEWTEGDQSPTIRYVCSTVLSSLLPVIDGHECCLPLGYMSNLFSAIIKLAQDEDYSIRLTSHQIILSLTSSKGTGEEHETKLGLLINYIVNFPFGGCDIATPKVHHAFRLLTRVMFNHCRNYSNSLIDDEEASLFDKTKLNTFADHVATIFACLKGLQTIFRNSQRKFEICDLQIPSEIAREFEYVNAAKKSFGGDYSYKKRWVSEDLPPITRLDGGSEGSNLEKFELLLGNILLSLGYFDYDNMLMDPEYTFHELSLLRRVAFVKFVTGCVKYEDSPKIRSTINEIRNRLGKITSESCATTILCKLSKLLSDELPVG